jgi:hypothetical protein
MTAARRGARGTGRELLVRARLLRTCLAGCQPGPGIRLGLSGSRAQRALSGGMNWDLFLASAFACFSARFSFRDLPAFLDMCCRGDLSAMDAPLRGHVAGPLGSPYAPLVPPRPSLRRRRLAVGSASLVVGRLTVAYRR